MNPHLKLAYDQGVRRAYAEMGITKTAISLQQLSDVHTRVVKPLITRPPRGSLGKSRSTARVTMEAPESRSGTMFLRGNQEGQSAYRTGAGQRAVNESTGLHEYRELTEVAKGPRFERFWSHHNAAPAIQDLNIAATLTGKDPRAIAHLQESTRAMRTTEIQDLITTLPHRRRQLEALLGGQRINRHQIKAINKEHTALSDAYRNRGRDYRRKNEALHDELGQLNASRDKATDLIQGRPYSDIRFERLDALRKTAPEDSWGDWLKQYHAGVFR